MPPNPSNIDERIDITTLGYDLHDWEDSDRDHLRLYLYTNNAAVLFRGDDIDTADDTLWFDNFEKQALVNALAGYAHTLE